MKAIRIIAASLLAVVAVACGPATGNKADAQASKAVKDLLPKQSQVDSVSYLLGINFGSMIKGYDFGDVNYAEILKGMKDFVNSEGNPRDEDFGKQFRINPTTMNQVVNGYLQKRHEYIMARNTEAEQRFLDANKAKDGVVVTESGLQYTILEPGNDNKATSDKDTVVVRYKGTLPNGEVFDQTTEDGDPVTFPLNHVIKGWTEGLQLVGEGGHLILVIPSELGYGENGSNGVIEPNTPLTFDVTIESVKHYVAPAEDKDTKKK